jgi:hypothetical protein
LRKVSVRDVQELIRDIDMCLFSICC